LNEVMSYSVLDGGKRFRPLLTISIAKMLGCDASVALPAACASELVHTASLMLDDLPCMDDASLRRFRPSCHVVYGEADTILAAIQLINLAYGELQGYLSISPTVAHELQAQLQEAIGGSGLIGGQIADLRSSVDRPSHALLDIYARKTSALFTFACIAGGILGKASHPELDAIRSFAHHLGLAFQLMDDLRDTTEYSGPVDKDRGKDVNKCTFMNITDKVSTIEAIRETRRFSDAQLSCFGEHSRFLREMVCEVFDGRMSHP
jgi:geranylgeranyl diphosphate synthase type II